MLTSVKSGEVMRKQTFTPRNKKRMDGFYRLVASSAVLIMHYCLICGACSKNQVESVHCRSGIDNPIEVSIDLSLELNHLNDWTCWKGCGNLPVLLFLNRDVITGQIASQEKIDSYGEKIQSRIGWWIHWSVKN